MTTSVIIPTKNEVIGVKEILTKIDRAWAEEWFLIDGKSWYEASRKMKIETIPNFIAWEESEFFSFLDSLLKPLGQRSNKELILTHKEIING